MKAAIAVLAPFAAGCATVAIADQPLSEAALATYPDARGMPADVQRFIVQWQDCAHWLGEPDWSEDRARQIAQAVAETCPGIDALGRGVRAFHSGDTEILTRIASYSELGQ